LSQIYRRYRRWLAPHFSHGSFLLRWKQRIFDWQCISSASFWSQGGAPISKFLKIPFYFQYRLQIQLVLSSDMTREAFLRAFMVVEWLDLVSWVVRSFSFLIHLWTKRIYLHPRCHHHCQILISIKQSKKLWLVLPLRPPFVSWPQALFFAL
jgi:hypothetical protein